MSAGSEPYRTVLAREAAPAASVRCSVLELDESAPDYTAEMDNLCFWLPLTGSTEVSPEHSPRSYSFRDSRIAILPPGSVWKGGWRGRSTCLLLEIAPALLRELTAAPVAFPENGRMLVTEDGQIRHSLLALYHDLTAASTASDLFVQHLARGVTLHYLRRYCHCPAGGERTRGRETLTPRQMDRLRDYIESRLQSKLTLEDLAGVAGMSVAAFCRRFKQTTGMPPYRYVLHTRVAHAKAALRARHRPLSEIALSLGFYDQSQFTNTFRRIVGLSPSAYRRRHAG